MSKQGEKIAASLAARISEIAEQDIEILIDAHGRFNVPKRRSVFAAFSRTLVGSTGSRSRCRSRAITRWEIIPILENHLTDYLMPDVTWTGGITELKKIATLAEAFYIPVSPHDASGPINVVAGAHVMMSTPNFYRLETSRWDLSNYNDFITVPLDNSDGRLKVPPKPGLGIEMNMDFLRGNVMDGFGGT